MPGLPKNGDRLGSDFLFDTKRHNYCKSQPTCVQTPSTTSTRTRAPSHSLEAVDTSVVKSTCPGVSIILIKYDFGDLPNPVCQEIGIHTAGDYIPPPPRT